MVLPATLPAYQLHRCTSTPTSLTPALLFAFIITVVVVRTEYWGVGGFPTFQILGLQDSVLTGGFVGLVPREGGLALIGCQLRSATSLLLLLLLLLMLLELLRIPYLLLQLLVVAIRDFELLFVCPRLLVSRLVGFSCPRQGKIRSQYVFQLASFRMLSNLLRICFALRRAMLPLLLRFARMYAEQAVCMLINSLVVATLTLFQTSCDVTISV